MMGYAIAFFLGLYAVIVLAQAIKRLRTINRIDKNATNVKGFVMGNATHTRRIIATPLASFENIKVQYKTNEGDLGDIHYQTAGPFDDVYLNPGQKVDVVYDHRDLAAYVIGERGIQRRAVRDSVLLLLVSLATFAYLVYIRA